MTMEKTMTLAEIEARFKSEWVLLENPKTGKKLEVKRGRVLCHSKDRDVVYRKAVALRPKKFAVLFTGAMPKDAAIVL